MSIFSYNSLLQLTRQTVAGVFDMESVFPAGANDGRVSSTIDHISGEQVNYTYDVLNRLTLAQTVSLAIAVSRSIPDSARTCGYGCSGFITFNLSREATSASA